MFLKFFTNILSVFFFFITITCLPVYADNVEGPALGRITSVYGYRTDPFSGNLAFHKGLDIAGPEGSPIYSLQDGIIAYTGTYKGYGNTVIIDHFFYNVPELPNVRTLYGHNAEILVKAGDYVRRGQVIARMGSTGRSTGPHLHFEVLYKGQNINPIEYLQKLPSYLEYANNIQKKSKNYMAGRSQYSQYYGRGGS